MRGDRFIFLSLPKVHSVDPMEAVSENIVILANGKFPAAPHCLKILENADGIICCDQAADHLINYGLTPKLIIGDLDSVSPETLDRFKGISLKIEEQETNDLTKAVNYCADKGYTSATILGATGLREDHTLGNISLLIEYNQKIRARIVSDYGEFSILKSGEQISSFPGEQISFFSVDNRVKVRSEGLKFQLENLQLNNWWRASLNEVMGDQFALHFYSELPLILFRHFPA
jgi:thiamine pyrophosphokinase